MTASKTDGVEELDEIWGGLLHLVGEGTEFAPFDKKMLSRHIQRLIRKTLDTELERLEKEAVRYDVGNVWSDEHNRFVNGLVQAVPLDTIHKYREGWHKELCLVHGVYGAHTTKNCPDLTQPSKDKKGQ